ncbi:uncharacterized protein LODBEIA_P52220 [Lodderomyces beijingensis]|uniref:Homologous-pairing protein 2 winged helix domain-containing protein n=1 Tax=Lodderomyces beijingensis TaxID=1775926 RepID=A0ABP0ZTK5_9ASCO
MPSVKTTLRSEVEARSFIRDYMKAQYRPYSTTDIQLNLHNQITKSKLAAILDSLLEEGELIVKTVGKTSYYCYKELFQAQEEPCDEDKREIEDHLARVHSEIESLTTGTSVCHELLLYLFLPSPLFYLILTSYLFESWHS